MHYNGPIVRPQTDADSLFIEVTVGCTHNKCTFCNFYDGYRFSIAPLEQIEEDLIEAQRMYPHVKKLWANGGNLYALSTERLAAVGKLFRKYFPESRISTYALLDNMKNDIRIFAAPNTTPFSFYVDLQPNKTELLRQMREFADTLNDEQEAEMSEQRSSRRSV